MVAIEENNENYIKENSNRKGLKKKIFIFMVHLFRIDRETKGNNMMMKNRLNLFRNEVPYTLMLLGKEEINNRLWSKGRQIY